MLDVPAVDRADFLHHFFLAEMMRQVVMAFRDPDFREGPVTSLVREQERGDARRIGLEGQDHHVEHEPDMVGEAAGNAGGRLDGGVRDVFETLGLLNSPLDFADARQVFVELLMVAFPELALEARGVVEHEIEDRPLLLAPHRQVLARSAGAPAPKSRSKTSRGFGSGATGRVGPLQDRLY